MFKKAIVGIAMVAAASVAAQAQDNLEASHSAGHLTSGGSAIYVGGAYTHSWTDIDTGGFNTVGTFFNFDCAGNHRRAHLRRHR